MIFELEQRAIRGDHKAILSLIEMDQDILYRLAITYMKNEQDAMDVMHFNGDISAAQQSVSNF
ncbi:RNA polymerase sigma factor [Lysinibacillus fusiformis]|uniref:hypothetical protein n=1 Tax=Lysinibacillus fusiformis TaxID=28031 RepID=UPI001CDA067B|nr:hypothetical protein [Lysinibacillus fusiformis]